MTECNYREMQLPFETVPFKEMNRKQAVQYLNWYIEVMDERIAYLENHVHETGGDVVFDYSPESLKPLWRCFMKRVEVIPMTRKEILDEMGNLEPWMETCIPVHMDKMSTYTWRVMYDITAYCGQVIIKNVPGIYWGCLSKPKSLVGVNEPRLLGFSHDMDYYLWGSVDACRIRGMRDPDDPGLYCLYEICKEMSDF